MRSRSSRSPRSAVAPRATPRTLPSAAAKLKALPDPIDFTEELRGTHALADYTIVKADLSDAAVMRFTVALKLKDKRGKPSDREAVYSVALKTPVVVARDPYF